MTDLSIPPSFRADPLSVIEPSLSVHLLTSGRSLTMGSGDRRPPTLRPGCLDASRLPSLIGGRLVYPEPKL